MDTTRNRILTVIALFVLPILLRVVFFYQFPYWNPGIQTPDYASYHVAEPPTPSSKAEPAAGVAAGKIILIDNAHGNQFQPDELEPFVTALGARGARVEFDKSDKPLQSRLKYASAYIIFSPSQVFTGDEILQVQQFVANGGRLLVFTDPTHSLIQYDSLGNATVFPDPNYANPLIAAYGLSFINDYLYDLKKNEGNFRNVEFTGFAGSPLTQDLKMVVFYGAHTALAQGGVALVTGGADVLSSLTDQGGRLSPLVLSANGQVLAAGDFTFLTNPYNQVADNELLLSHIADFAVSAQRTPVLANFPFVFQHAVSLISTGNVGLSSNLLAPIAVLQQSLRAVNISLKLGAAPSNDTDNIILGAFTPGADLRPYLEPFNISLDDPRSIDLPGFGRISKTGNGLLLFDHGPKTNTLILLAGTSSDLAALIKLVASGDLSGCVVQGSTGVCSLSTGSGSSGNTSSFSGFYDSSTPTPTPTPVGP